MKFSGHHKNTPLIAFPFAENESIVHHNDCSLRSMINYWCLLFMSLIYSREEGVVNDITVMHALCIRWAFAFYKVEPIK